MSQIGIGGVAAGLGQAALPLFNAMPPSEIAPNSENYESFYSVVSYTGRMGVLGLPVAVDPTGGGLWPEQTVVRSAAPRTKKIVRYYAKRLNDLPKVPAPQTEDSNLELEAFDVLFEIPPLDVGGQLYRFAACVQYIYLMRRPHFPWLTDSPVGAAPFTQAEPADNAFPAEQFVADIVDDAQTGGDVVIDPKL